MPKIDNNISNIVRTSAIRNYLFLISILSIISACSAGNNSLANNSENTGNYSFNNLITHNIFYTSPTTDECPYIPESAINSDPNLQPPQAKCTSNNNSHTQIADGCDVDSNNPENLGNRLSKSVVGIAVPLSSGEKANSVQTICTGTIIESNLVITAAHCLAKFRGEFNQNIEYSVIVPWQKKLNGIPKRPFNKNGITINYPIKAIYIPYHFNNFGVYPPKLPYPEYLPGDIALIELESSLPQSYIPIALESRPAEQLFNHNKQFWRAGFGRSDNDQDMDGKLRYRDYYYYSNRYDIDSTAWPQAGEEGPSLNKGNNYGMIYTLGSPPAGSSTGPEYAWHFMGGGDSGGPLLYENADKQLSLFGVTGYSLYCGYAGYYAQLPYPFDENTSIESYYPLIQKIMNKTVNTNEARCIAKSGNCISKMVYVLSSQNNSISVYQRNGDKSLEFKQRVTTGQNPYAFTFDSQKHHILVANYGSPGQGPGSINVFNVQINGLLNPAEPAQQFNVGDKLVQIVANYNNNIYVVGKDLYSNNNVISKLTLNPNTGFLTPENSVLIPSPNINKLKLADSNLYAIDTMGNIIYQFNHNLTSIPTPRYPNFNQPTDLIVNEASQILAVNSGNNTLVTFNSFSSPDKSYSSEITKPYQIIALHSYNYFYITSFANNSIASFDGVGPIDMRLTFRKEVATGKGPIDMTTIDSQLFEVNEADNTLWQYDLNPGSSNYDLTFVNSIDLGIKPTAVLAN